ncbi:MAG: GTP cyclohydrolase II, partial [Cyanobacteria bacterium J06560_2]
PDLVDYAKQHKMKLISIADLISYRLKHERFVTREAIAKMPSKFGDFQVYAYRNQLDGSEHIALVKGDPETFKDEPVMVRMHSECLTGDALGSLRCDCRMQLQATLKMIENAGKGAVVYLRQEGRGIGLVNKLKAYSLQDMGLDTVEANERLGLPVDQRNYGMGAQILMDLGIKQFRLITNNPRKIAGLKGYGLEMVDRVPLLIEATTYNSDYLATKAKKLGHFLLQTYLVTVAIQWREQDATIANSAEELATARYERLEQLRSLAQKHGLLLQEEARSVAVAVFGQMPLIVHLGLDQAGLADEHWYKECTHPYVNAIASLLDELLNRSDIEQLEFLVSSGSDPFTQLQIRLDRQILPWASDPQKDPQKRIMPSDICQKLETQRIYVFCEHIDTLS